MDKLARNGSKFLILIKFSLFRAVENSVQKSACGVENEMTKRSVENLSTVSTAYIHQHTFFFLQKKEKTINR